MNMFLFVSNDKYELPLAVCDSTTELAECLGLKKTTVSSQMCRAVSGKSKYASRYVRVAFEPEGKHFSGRLLYRIRRLRKMQIQRLAEEMHITVNQLMAWESGKTEPDVGRLLELAEVLGTDADSFFE